MFRYSRYMTSTNLYTLSPKPSHFMLAMTVFFGSPCIVFGV